MIITPPQHKASNKKYKVEEITVCFGKTNKMVKIKNKEIIETTPSRLFFRKKDYVRSSSNKANQK